MAAAIWVRVPLFGQFLLQTPVTISGQFYSKSARQLQAFLNSQDLQRCASVREAPRVTKRRVLATSNMRKESGNICTFFDFGSTKILSPIPMLNRPFYFDCFMTTSSEVCLCYLKSPKRYQKRTEQQN